MSNYKRKEVFDYLTRKPVTTQDIELARSRIQTSVPSQQMQLTPEISNPQVLELATGGRAKFQNAGSATLPINPMIDNINPNTVGGAAIIPAAGITAAAIADRFNISLEDAGRMLKRLYTGPEGLVIGGDRLTEEAKPDIEKFLPPEKIKTDIGLIPTATNKKSAGFEIDKGENTNILFNRKPDTEKQKIVETTFIELKEKLGRDPSVTEVADKLNIHVQSADNFLRDLDFVRQVGSARYASFKEVGDPKVKKIINTSEGNKWPDQETKDFYEDQIIQRYKYPTNSVELKKKYETKELLSNEELAKKYNIGLRSVENINSQIIENYKLKQPVLGREETRKEKDLRRKEAKEKFTSPTFESREAGTVDVNLGHASDLYNIPVKLETLTATPRDINKALKNLDYFIKDVYEKQKELIDNKPKNWKEKVERLNDIGIEYASQSEGYKTFEPIDLKTLKRKPVSIDYSKIIDPTGIYVNKKGEGKTTIEAEKEINLTELNKIEKAFSDYIQGNKVKNPELITEENFNKLKNYKLYKINYESVFEKEKRKPISEIENIVEKLEKIKKLKYATGGRVHLKNGTDDGYFQEIPSLGLSDPIEILEQQMANEKDPIKILALDYKLEQMKKRKLQEETKAAEEKKLQKEKGIRYMEDFPSQTDYFVETGKQLLTNPKYFYGKGLKGIAEGTEWLVGQPLQTLFSQEGKNWEFYQPVAGEKLGINKFIEENIPKGATTGTLLAGDVAEIAGSIADPFLAYGLVKGAVKGAKPKPTTSTVEDTVDPMRRDILKTSAVMGTGAALYPIAKNINILEDLGKVVPKKAPLVKIIKPLGATETQFPEWFPSLVNRIRKEGETIPIYRTEKIPITKEEFMEGIKKTEKVKGEKFYANPRTEEYFRQNPNEFPYYKTKETEDIIGYEYVDKNLPDVKVVEYEGKELDVYFKNNYYQDVQVNYKTPGITEKGEFTVRDYQPEAGSYPDSAPDMEEVIVKNMDEVFGGASKIEQYATKSKKPRYTKGEAIVDEAEGRALAEYDRMKDEGLLDE